MATGEEGRVLPLWFQVRPSASLFQMSTNIRVVKLRVSDSI